ncbi:MAG TPA: ribose-5-phosphate isomerase RpiA [Trueperaceae bacterium]|nr:ribose-5-phosphate isomerase RpiA [Trueperaceae bacterium]
MAQTPGSDGQKRDAAAAALELVEDGMTLGLGTGSTAYWFVAGVAERLRSGALQRVRGVPTSEATARQAREAGIELVDLPAAGVDLAVDGMDELAPGLDAVKGLGGALLREKVVAASARAFVLIGDESKLVSRLGEKAPVPVEVVRFGLARTVRLLGALGGEAVVRERDGAPVVTDNGNLVVDLRFAGRFDPEELAAELSALPGVVEHGLFLGMADLAFVAGQGGVRRLGREA